VRPLISRKKLSVVVLICHPKDGRKPKIEDFSSEQPGKKTKSYLQNNQSKKGLRCSSLALSSNPITKKKKEGGGCIERIGNEFDQNTLYTSMEMP
jgi:hypothetical protein